jgi:Flp pilus assembly protein TadD
MFGWCRQKVLGVARWGPGGERPAILLAVNRASPGASRPSARSPSPLILGAVVILAVFLSMGIGCNTSRWAGGPMDRNDIFSTKIRPASGDTARLLRNAHYFKLMGQPQLALKELEEAHALDPDNLKVVDTLAHCYEEVGQFDRAQKLYQEALSRHGANPALNNNLCFSYYLSGRWEQAEACYRQVLARDPGNRAARNNLGLLYCRTGKIEEARRLWREAEGKAAAEKKVNQAMAALGMSAPTAYAQSDEAAPAKGKLAETPAKEGTRAKTGGPRPMATVQAPSPGGARLARRTEIAAKPAEAPPAATSPAVAAAPRPVTKTVKKDQAAAPKVSQIAATAPRPVAETVKKEQAAASKATQPAAVAPKPVAEIETVKKDQAAAPKVSQIAATAPRPVAETVKKEQAAAPKATQPAAVAPKPVAEIETVWQDQVAVPEATQAVAAASRPVAETETVKKDQTAAAEASQPAAVAKTSHTATNPAPDGPNYLTCKELVETGIEVRNGAGTRFLAHRTRSMLTLEGFTVKHIGNYLDFGAKKTLIYYRPGAQRVVRFLRRDFFPTAKAEQKRKLRKGVQVKVVLGHDFVKRPDLMAQLARGSN